MNANKDRLLQLQAKVTPRDDRLLGWLYDHGVLTTRQIAHALFPSEDFAQRRLLHLTSLNAVSRFRPQRWEGGSHPYHYVLDQLGYEHVMGQRGLGMPAREQAKRRKQSLISRPDLLHLLGTNQLFTDLAGYERTHPGTRLARWLPASDYHDPGAFFRLDAHPQLILAGARLPRPDGHGIWLEGGRAVPFFTEYDTGTERLEVLVEKVGKYNLLSTWAETWMWPVLFHLPTLSREMNLHQRLTDAGSGKRIVIATTAADYLETTGLSPADQVWSIHHGQGRIRLSEMPYRDAEHDQEWSSAN